MKKISITFLLCGVFNLKVEGLERTIENTLVRLFKNCRIALAFNALSSHNPKKYFELHYVSPEKIFEFSLKNLSAFISLRYDQISYDFTIFVYKDAKR